MDMPSAVWTQDPSSQVEGVHVQNCKVKDSPWCSSEDTTLWDYVIKEAIDAYDVVKAIGQASLSTQYSLLEQRYYTANRRQQRCV